MNQSNPTQASHSTQSKNYLPNVPLDEADLPTMKSATQETLERLEYEAGTESLNLNSQGEELNEEGVPLNQEDTNYKSELEFDGYQDIQDYDNDSYSQNVDRSPNTTQPLQFKDRAEHLSGEESPVDPQENRASGAI